MMSLIIVLSVVLILAILFLIFRVGTLSKLAKGSKDGEVSTNNGIHGTLFLVSTVIALIAFFWYSYNNFGNYSLPVASEHGVKTDRLFWVTMTVTVIAFTIISIIMAVFIYKYRYQKGRKASFYPDNHYLELSWTIIPAIVLALLIFKGLTTWNEITSPASEEAEVIEVVAKQFDWTVRYAGNNDKTLGKVNYKLIDPFNEFGLDLTDKNSFDDFKAPKLYLPKGKEVLLKIRAKDVLHSVFIPHFRVKMDAVPGMPTQFKFTVNKTTEEMRVETGNPKFEYELACTEICGRGHFSMRLEVVVLEVEEYEKWKSEQESWLSQNPDYLKSVPDELKEAARISAGIQEVAASTEVAVSEVK
jgi:cytochrome c oxidase subunit 2